MKWVTDFTDQKGFSFEIEREAVIGEQRVKELHRYMLRAFDPLGSLDVEYLQEDLIEAQMHALKKWGVPLGSWECHL